MATKPDSGQAAGQPGVDPSLTITIATGAVLGGPATEGLRVYEVQEVGGELQLRA